MRIAVIGAGIAGMSAALMASQKGHDVTIVAKGMGGLGLSSGFIDVYSWTPEGEAVENPFEFESLPADHPYKLIDAQSVRNGTSWLMDELGFFAEPTDLNSWVPTAVGAVRPAYGIPMSMVDSVLINGGKYLVLGVRQFKDFPAQLIADNLTRSPHVNISARARTIDFPAREREHDTSATNFARALDREGAVTAFAAAITEHARPDEVALIPAIAGLAPDTFTALRAAVRSAGATGLAEVSVPPPSIPGRRIYEALLTKLRDARVDIQLNAYVSGFTADVGTITHLKVERAGGPRPMRIDAVIDAAGGLESGNISRDSYMTLREEIFGLEVIGNAEAMNCGIAVDSSMHPLNSIGEVAYKNLVAAGDVIGGGQRAREKSGEGIALGSAWAAVTALENGK